MSSAYVERRESALADHKALDGAGKRAAFALYYGPIHYLLVRHIVEELGIAPERGTIVDLGCGTGVAGAAVATSATTRLPVVGIDTHPWTLDEALGMVKDLEGKAFDPVVVKAAVELHERGELALPATPNPDVTKVAS